MKTIKMVDSVNLSVFGWLCEGGAMRFASRVFLFLSTITIHYNFIYLFELQPLIYKTFFNYIIFSNMT